MSYIQRLGGEGVWLHLHISSGDLVYEAGLANVRESWRRDVKTKHLELGNILLNVFLRDRIMLTHREIQDQVYIKDISK